MAEQNDYRILVGFARDPELDSTKLCDKLTIYFQRQSVSGGCDVKLIELQRDRTSGKVNAALVYFDDHQGMY